MDLLLQLPDLHRLGDRAGQRFGPTVPVLSQYDQSEALHLRPLLGDNVGFRRSGATKASQSAQLGDAAARVSGVPSISGLDSETALLPRAASQPGDGSVGLPVLQ